MPHWSTQYGGLPTTGRIGTALTNDQVQAMLDPSAGFWNNKYGQGAQGNEGQLWEDSSPGGISLLAQIMSAIFGVGALPGGGAGAGGAAAGGGAAGGAGAAGAGGAAASGIPVIEGLTVTAPSAGIGAGTAAAGLGAGGSAASFLNSGDVSGVEVTGNPQSFTPADALPYVSGLAPSTQPLMQVGSVQPAQQFSGEPGGNNFLRRALDMLPRSAPNQGAATGQSGGAPAAQPTGSPFGGGGPGAGAPAGLAIKGSTAPDIYPWRR